VREVGSIYDAPVVKGGVVYVGSDRGKAYAFDAETGEEIWNKEFESPEEYATPAVDVEAVEDGIVYVTAYGNLYEIDEESGDEVRRHDGDRFSGIEVSGGTVYASQSGRIVAYEDGDELWRYESVGVNPRIRGTAHGNVYFGEGRDLVALDAAEGKQVWSIEVGEDYPVSLGGSSVYFGERDLHAVSPDGDELWSMSLDGSNLDGLSIAGGYVYAVTENKAYRTEEGEVLNSVEVPAENVRNHVVGEYVYVGTDEGVYALDV
jgi:outer membrane protein assembly factor BamB